jgi:hypothetical protein
MVIVSPVLASDIVVDNDDDAPGYVETGSWATSASTGYNGGTYRYVMESPPQPPSSATWTPNLPTNRLYSVYAAYRQSTNRPTIAPITITHASGATVVYLNQNGANEIVETFLGEFFFDAGTSGTVRMDNNGSVGSYIADAMIWRTPTDPPPSISHVTRNPEVPSQSDPVLVTAIITDNNVVTSTTLHYTISPPGMSEILPAYDDGAHGDGSAGDHVYGAAIPAQPDNATVSFYYMAWDDADQSSVSSTQYYVVGQQPRNVYIVLSSDTSVWNGTPSLSPGSVLNWNVFSSQTGVLSKVYKDSFRDAHVDSLGKPFKLSWFMHGGAWFNTASNSVAISALYHIRKNWGDEISAYGDALEYHFHHYIWNGNDWVQAPTFSETIWEYEWAMSAMMLDEHLFITAFRSGWNYMDNPYEQYLERWAPFRMEGVQSNWLPYHPSFSDWKAAGTMKGWEARHIYMKSFTPAVANQVFSAASTGADRVVCIWSHQNETDYPEQIAAVDLALHTAASAYPSVQFHYCSAKEAMQKWLNHGSGNVPPPLEVFPTISGDNVNVTIQTIDDIYQEQPWVAVRKYTDEYVRLDSVKTGVGAWQFSYSREIYDHVAVGVSDIYGNDAIAEVDDGSRRWAVQSEFADANPFQVDFDSSPTCARLVKSGGNYMTSGTLTFDHEAPFGEEWKSIILDKNAPSGASIRCRYKTADTHELLDTSPWSSYQTDSMIMMLSPESLKTWIRIEVLLEGTSLVTPKLDSLEVTYDKPGSRVDLWKYY